MQDPHAPHDALKARAIAPRFPLVVHVALAGSRQLYDARAHPELRAEEIERQVAAQCEQRLRELPAALGLSDQHFLCGVSQLAAGVDTAFASACQVLGMPQRILLPERADNYLQAASAGGQPDFTPAQRETASQLLASPHIIEVRVASTASDRTRRFEETNLALLRGSDVVLCLVRENAVPRAGGTASLIRRARAMGKPVLELGIHIVEGRAVVQPLKPLREWDNGPDYTLPGVAPELADLALPAPGAFGTALPSASAYIAAIKAHSRARTQQHRKLFNRGAAQVIGFHVLATVLAAGVLAFHPPAPWTGLMLGLELLLIGLGLYQHRRLHHESLMRAWAVTRASGEAMRSLSHAHSIGEPLDYALALPWDGGLLPLLNTCCVLGHRDRRLAPPRDSESDEARALRATYLQRRLLEETGLAGQLPYYRFHAADATRQFRRLNRWFWRLALAAITATSLKLLLSINTCVAGWPCFGPPPALLITLAGLTAILAPVAAVGFLSWASAGDLDARAKTFDEMQRFLAHKVDQLKACEHGLEFHHLVREVETHLLGENLQWYARRIFVSVA
jgi:hypothetical protein